MTNESSKVTLFYHITNPHRISCQAKPLQRLYCFHLYISNPIIRSWEYTVVTEFKEGNSKGVYQFRQGVCGTSVHLYT